ncbi:ATP-dependent Clp protease proteolytic subunit [Streptomyces sp. ISL-11]|uniref:ATP-dependent Clp protease proteolytic subunit n=1 Tax=Streptomyces sp. ISL-11 TaxID=2819174 RepID=UPI001BEA1E30|nr:ATP-dependent Clp protease proteolytic subunit [Streptomyces sp. ISL-11]MBT2387599.1 ATP-dependent Clp protease proteolytic subunit [Streptomyces sp. ISL-11]
MHHATARHVLPEFTERTSYGTRSMDPYSKLLSERIVFLGTPVDDASANDVIAQFMYLEHAGPDQDISLYINSPGGSVSAMTAIYDTMRYVGCDVETICLGQAASSAAVLLAAGTPGKRLALPHARVLIHQPSLAEPVRGQASDLSIQAAELLRTRDTVEEMLVRHTGQSAERIRRDTERDKIFDAEGALAYGLVDRLTSSRKQQDLLHRAR